MKYLFYDFETTGLDPKRHSIHQLSGIIEIDGQEVERFDIKFRPLAGREISQEALDLKGLTVEQLNAYPEAAFSFNQFVNILAKHVDRYSKTDKMFLVGYNNRAFDDQFLIELFNCMGDKYFGSWFWYNTIDVFVLATYAYRYKRPLLPNFKLMTVAKLSGIEVNDDSLHDALYDVELTRGIFKALTKNAEKP